MINKPPPFKGLNIRIPITTPIKGRGFINQGSGLGLRIWGLGRFVRKGGMSKYLATSMLFRLIGFRAFSL